MAVVQGLHADVYLPFWKLTGNTTKGNSAQHFVPAFGQTRFEQIYRICRRASHLLPNMSAWSELQGSDAVIPASLSPDTAAAIAEATIYRARHENDMGEFEAMPVPEEFTANKVDIVYVPCRANDYFYVDTVSGDLSVERALVEFGNNF
jgi:hypothetical protein